MQANVLIVDSIATNRMALKVKLADGWYETDAVDGGASALSLVAKHVPNLIIASNTISDMNLPTFFRQLTGQLGQNAPPVLALSSDPLTRTSLLQLGFEDVLPWDGDDQMLLARIRAVLRASAAEEEWRLREGTSRALGFAEPRNEFSGPVPVMILRETDSGSHMSKEAARSAGLLMSEGTFQVALREDQTLERPAVLVLDLSDTNAALGLTALADLRANARTRHKAILVAAPSGRTDLAAHALDMGADEATVGPLCPRELSLRAKRLHRRHEMAGRLRALVKTGAEAAVRDQLTGLYNRRYALPHLERIADQSRLSGQPYAVMIADLDHFKQVNDQHGHDAGDAVLVECAKRLQANMRAGDLVARLGGEEFLIVLPASDRTRARQAAMRLCRRVSEKPFQIPGRDTGVTVTISVGLALNDAPMDDLFGHHDSDPQNLLARADEALYRAKENGRNRFMLERSAAA